MNIAAVNLGCKVNHVELEEFVGRALETGASLVGLSEADVILINTCTVTGEAERKTRKAVNRALAANPHADVILTGCSVAINPEAYRALDSRISVVPKNEVEACLQALGTDAASAHEQELSASSGLFRSRTGIKIQDGCDNACTFCIVHTARGPARSLPRAVILDQAARLVEAGRHEIVLTGINLGSYADEQGRLASLVRDILQVAEELGARESVRLRLSSIEPTDIEDDLVELMAASGGRICRHLHIPLQSGSTKVLRDMDRRYDADWFAEMIRSLRTIIPQIALSTDCIVGFPGETEEDFEDTCALCRDAGFSKIHVFPYSPRSGTPAASRTDQVPAQTKQERAKRFRDLSAELRAADFALRIGSTESVIAEGDGFGMTESYHRIPVPAGTPTGALIRCTLEMLE